MLSPLLFIVVQDLISRNTVMKDSMKGCGVFVGFLPHGG